MDRREFFKRTIPATAVTVAAFQGGWTMDFFTRLLGKVLRAVEAKTLDVMDREAQIIRQLKYQSRKAMEAMANRISRYFYAESGVLATIGDEPKRLLPA
jgi:hypothetical protein